jgi:radical SAM protein with 4Fe4S-binding SPASM domain
MLCTGAARSDIIQEYHDITGATHEETLNDLEKFLKPLIDVGVVYEKETPPVIPPVKTQFSVSAAAETIASVVINPTCACNYHCTHCYTDSRAPLDNELTTEEMISILGDIIPFMRPKILGFLGGEPLLRKSDVLKVTKFWTHDHAGYASLSTNGSLIDEQFAQKAHQNKLVVQVSVDGSNPQTCDAVRGTGSFDKAVKGAQICVDHKVKTWLCMVYHTGNIDELEDFIALGEHIGVDGVRFIPYNYLGRGASSNLVKVMPYTMVKNVHKILKKHPEWGDFIDQSFFANISVIVRSAPRYVYCGSGLATLLIESNGDLYPCINLVYPEFKIGNLREHTFADLWFNSPILKKIRSLCVEDANEYCSSCPVKYMCGMGCRSEIYELTRVINLPTFFCESWKKSIYEMCWILDEFPTLHQKVTSQRQTWPAQHTPLVDTEKAHHVLSQMCG